MSRVMDWLLDQMDLGAEEVEETEETNLPIFSQSVFYKVIAGIEDAKITINKYRDGNTCVAQFDLNAKDPQGIMNYLSGAIYALDGKIEMINSNTFLVK